MRFLGIGQVTLHLEKMRKMRIKRRMRKNHMTKRMLRRPLMRLLLPLMSITLCPWRLSHYIGSRVPHIL